MLMLLGHIAYRPVLHTHLYRPTYNRACLQEIYGHLLWLITLYYVLTQLNEIIIICYV